MSELFRFAVVQSADENGVTVKFEEDSEPSGKKYTRLQSCDCVPGERVLMASASGSYVAIGVVDRKCLLIANAVLDNDHPDKLIRFRVSNGHYYAWSEALGWKQIG